VAEAPERAPTDGSGDELASLRRELAAERGLREAGDAENARLQAQIESYAEDLNSLYQERHGRGRGGLAAELSNVRAELADESARREVLGELYQRSTLEARSLGDQLVSYGQDLARAYRSGKKVGGRPGPTTPWERAGAAALMLGMLGVVAAGLLLSPPELATAGTPSPAVGEATVAAPTASQASGVRLVSSDDARPTFDGAPALAAAAAATAAARGLGESAAMGTAVARQVGSAIGTATALAEGAATAAATARGGGARVGMATALAGESAATATVLARQVGATIGTATAAANGAATARADGGRTATATAGATSTARPTATPGADLRPTITALVGAIGTAAAESTIRAGTATAFAGEAGAVAATATSFVLTATAPTATPTAETDARRGPPGALGDLERCSWEVPIPSIEPGRGYHVQFGQRNRATVTVLWSHGESAMALARSGDGAAEQWRTVAEVERGDVVESELPPGTYRVRLENRGEVASAESVVGLFYDELALCNEPAAWADDAPVATRAATVVESAAGASARPLLDCRPYVRAPYGFVQLQPRLWIDRVRRVEGTAPVKVELTGPGTSVTLELVAGPGRRAERIPLTQPGRYELRVLADGVELHENCTQGFWFERTQPGLPTLVAPRE
jgi:hypothetical protein